MKIILLAATDKNNAIGKDGKLPWRIKSEMQHFVRTTKGKVVLMGRKTFESVGVLPDRINIVMTKTIDPENVYTVDGFCQLSCLLDHLKMPDGGPIKELYVIGGAEIYKQFLPLAGEVIVSRIKLTVDGADAFFPDLKRVGGWEKVSKGAVRDEETDIQWVAERWVHRPETTVGELEEAIFRVEGVRVMFRLPANKRVKNYPLYHRPLGVRSTLRPLVSRLLDDGFVPNDFVIINGHGTTYTYTDIMSGSARDISIESVRRSYIAPARWI